MPRPHACLRGLFSTCLADIRSDYRYGVFFRAWQGVIKTWVRFFQRSFTT